MNKLTCKSCQKKFKSLTSCGLCACCYQREKGTWAKEFTNEDKTWKKK